MPPVSSVSKSYAAMEFGLVPQLVPLAGDFPDLEFGEAAELASAVTFAVIGGRSRARVLGHARAKQLTSSNPPVEGDLIGPGVFDDLNAADHYLAKHHHNKDYCNWAAEVLTAIAATLTRLLELAWFKEPSRATDRAAIVVDRDSCASRALLYTAAPGGNPDRAMEFEDMVHAIASTCHPLAVARYHYSLLLSTAAISEWVNLRGRCHGEAITHADGYVTVHPTKLRTNLDRPMMREVFMVQSDGEILGVWDDEDAATEDARLNAVCMKPGTTWQPQRGDTHN